LQAIQIVVIARKQAPTHRPQAGSYPSPASRLLPIAREQAPTNRPQAGSYKSREAQLETERDSAFGDAVEVVVAAEKEFAVHEHG
jgi:hypothetical protein